MMIEDREREMSIFKYLFIEYVFCFYDVQEDQIIASRTSSHRTIIITLLIILLNIITGVAATSTGWPESHHHPPPHHPVLVGTARRTLSRQCTKWQL